jgi:MoxR-like ATPase
MFNVLIGYPELADEVAIVEATTGVLGQEPAVVLEREDVLAYQQLVREVQPQEQVTRYAVQLVRATRVGTPEAASAAQEFLAWGAGPRAAQDLIRGAKTRALLQGRETPSLDDIRRLAHPVLRHRLVTNFHAEAESVAKDTIIDRILAEVDA